jgi:hypothetical protein
MESFSDPLYSKVHALAVGLLEGTLAPAERLELETLLLENHAARRCYLEYVQENACLRWLCVEEFPSVIELANKTRDGARSGRGWRRIVGVVSGGGLACTLVTLAANWWLFGNENTAKSPEPGTAAVAGAGVANAQTAIEAPGLPSVKTNSVDQQAVATITGLGAVRWQVGSDARLC